MEKAILIITGIGALSLVGVIVLLIVSSVFGKGDYLRLELLIPLAIALLALFLFFDLWQR